MNDFEIYETVKEFTVYPGLISEPIKARIVKLRPANEGDTVLFFWFISHYYKPEQNAIDVYIPSRSYSASLIEVEELLMNYINNFTGIGVKKNTSF